MRQRNKEPENGEKTTDMKRTWLWDEPDDEQAEKTLKILARANLPWRKWALDLNLVGVGDLWTYLTGPSMFIRATGFSK